MTGVGNTAPEISSATNWNFEISSVNRKQLEIRINLPREFNAVAEYNPPFAFATEIQAELFWNSDDSWETIAKRARMRARPER